MAYENFAQYRLLMLSQTSIGEIFVMTENNFFSRNIHFLKKMKKKVHKSWESYREKQVFIFTENVLNKTPGELL